MAHLFLSYVSEDESLAKRLAVDLRSSGVQVWLARDEILPGEWWDDSIRTAIKSGAFFVACFSPAYYQRDSTYMNEELTLATEELRKRPHHRTWFIPVILSECEIPDLPLGAGRTLRSLQSVSLDENWTQGVRKLLQVVQPLSRLERDLADPKLRRLLRNSNLHLLAVDRAVVSWFSPQASEPSEWGWSEDSQVHLSVEERLFDATWPKRLKEIATAFREAKYGGANSVRYCVTQYWSEPLDSGGKLHLVLEPIRYLSAYSVMRLLMDETSPEGRNLRATFFSRLEGRDHPFTPNTLDIQITVITGDRQMLLCRRRADEGLHFMRGRWSATLEEQLNGPWQRYLQREEVYSPALVTDSTIFSAFRRALKEELRLKPEEIEQCNLRILAVGFEYDSLGTSLYAVAELPEELTYRRVAPTLLAHDEFDTVACCPFDWNSLTPVLEKSSAPDNLMSEGEEAAERWRWHSSSRLRIVLALMTLAGVDDVLKWISDSGLQ